jgi:putative membrane protein
MFQLIRKAFNFWLAVGAISLFRNKGKLLPYLGYFLAAMLLFLFLRALLEYLFFKLNLEEERLLIRKGIFRKTILTIPLDKIQAVHLQQKILNILTGTVGVSIDTPGTEKAEVSIKALKQSEAEELRQMLLKDRVLQDSSDSTETGILLHLQPRDLLRLSLTVNHFRTILIIAGFLISIWQQVEEFTEMRTYDKLDRMSEGLQPALMTYITWGLFLFGIAMLVSGILTILRFYDLQVKTDPGGFTIKWGLVQTRQHIIPFRKIQMLQWQTNFIRRRMGIYQLEIRSAGEGIFTKKERMLVPTMDRQHTRDIIRFYQPESPADQGEKSGIQKAYYIRRLLWICLPMTAAISFISAYRHQPEWIGALVIPVYLGIHFYLYRRNFRFWISEKGIQVLETVWGRKYSLLNWEKLQLVSKKQNLYQRKAGYADVVLRTAAGTVRIPYLKSDEADQLVNTALYVLEKEGKGWV